MSSQAEPRSAGNAVSDGADLMLPVLADPQSTESTEPAQSNVLVSSQAEPQSAGNAVFDGADLMMPVRADPQSAESTESAQSNVLVSSQAQPQPQPQQSAFFLQNLWSTSTESLSATVISTLSSPAEPQSTTGHVRGRSTVTKKKKNVRNVRKQNASVAKHVYIPSGSEDSALSAPDDNDETEILAKEQKCARRLSSEQQKAELRKRYVWKNDTLFSDDVFSEFSGNVYLPQNVRDLQTPLQFFSVFFVW